MRLNDDQCRRLAVKAKALGPKLLAEVATIVTPEILLAWHRKLIAQKYDGSGKRGPWRPHAAEEIEALVARMAEENRDWGYRRIQGALSNLGHELARSTIAGILKRHGIEPVVEIAGIASVPNGLWMGRNLTDAEASGLRARPPSGQTRALIEQLLATAGTVANTGSGSGMTFCVTTKVCSMKARANPSPRGCSRRLRITSF